MIGNRSGVSGELEHLKCVMLMGNRVGFRGAVL